MGSDVAAVNPRSLVIYFHLPGQDLSDYTIEDDKGARPQLVHSEKIPNPSFLERISFFLWFKLCPSKASKVSNWRRDQAITDAHRFVCRHYRSGDRVILVASKGTTEELINALEVLARHLHDGTTPGKPSKKQPVGGNTDPGRRTPVYAIVALETGCDLGGMPGIHDGFKSRFPLGIEQTLYYEESDADRRGCSTVRDLDGNFISRATSVYDDPSIDWLSRLVLATKAIIYYNPEVIPGGDEQNPLWTKVPGSSSSCLPRNFPLSMLPEGIYQRKVRPSERGPKGSNRLFVFLRLC